MQLPLVLAIDLGTSSVRSALFDPHGQPLDGSLAQRTTTLQTSQDGRAEMEPASLLERVNQCIAETRTHGSPVAIGVSCFWHSLMGTTEDGTPLTPIYTWADSRCRDDAAALRAELPEQAVHLTTGCMLRASFWPAKLRWLRRTAPGVFRRVKRWMSPAEWIQLQLTGTALCSHGMATGTGLYDPRRLRWSEELLSLCEIEPHQLNPLGDAPYPWQGADWYPAIGDGAASNLGSDATGNGRAAINVGTSAAIRVMHHGSPGAIPFGLFCYRVDESRYVVGGAVSNAGNLHAWCQQQLNLPGNLAELENALGERPTPEHGLTVLPFWNAERAPDWNEEACGVIHGITMSTTSLDLLQAITEGFYYRLAKIADLVSEGQRIRWLISGGILNSPNAVQRLADVMGRQLQPCSHKEASLRGAAIFALNKMGHSVPSSVHGEPIKPRRKYTTAYRQARNRADMLERHSV